MIDLNIDFVYLAFLLLRKCPNTGIDFNSYFSCQSSIAVFWSLDNMILPTDRDTAVSLMEMYQKKGCWTWYQDWHWPMQETLFKQGRTSVPETDSGRHVNLNILLLPPLPPASKDTSGLLLRVYRKLNSETRKIRNFG